MSAPGALCHPWMTGCITSIDRQLLDPKTVLYPFIPVVRTLAFLAGLANSENRHKESDDAIIPAAGPRLTLTLTEEESPYRIRRRECHILSLPAASSSSSPVKGMKKVCSPTHKFAGTLACYHKQQSMLVVSAADACTMRAPMSPRRKLHPLETPKGEPSFRRAGVSEMYFTSCAAGPGWTQREGANTADEESPGRKKSLGMAHDCFSSVAARQGTACSRTGRASMAMMHWSKNGVANGKLKEGSGSPKRKNLRIRRLASTKDLSLSVKKSTQRRFLKPSGSVLLL